MRKLTFAAVVAAALSLTACNNGATSADATKDTNNVSKEQTTEPQGKDTSNPSASTAGDQTSATGDVDKAIDAYEANITKYAEIAKKVQAGDASVAAEAQKLMKELTDASQTLGAKAATLSAAQQKRLAEIGQKMAAAMGAPTGK